MTSKKAQMQLMQSTIVLFVIFFLIIIGLTIYTQVQSSRLDNVEEQFQSQRAAEIAKKVVSTVEVQCSNDNVVQEDCFEVQKLRRFSEISNESQYYRRKFGSSKATIRWVYAPVFTGDTTAPDFFNTQGTPRQVKGEEKSQVLFDFSSGKEDKIQFTYPITLWDKRYVPQRSYFGWLTVEVY